MFRKTKIFSLILVLSLAPAGQIFAQGERITRDQLGDYYAGYADAVLKKRGLKAYLERYLHDDYKLVSTETVRIPGRQDLTKDNQAGKASLIVSTLDAQEKLEWKSLKPRMQNVVIGQDGLTARVVNHMTGTANAEVQHPATQDKATIVMFIQSTCVDDFVSGDQGLQVIHGKCTSETTFQF